jgi:RNA-binding protein
LELTAKQRHYLMGLAHALEPIVQVGNKGITPSLIEQIADQLRAHELIKVRFNTQSGVEPVEVTDQLVTGARCQLVQRVGRIVVLYRRHDERPKIEIPKG